MLPDKALRVFSILLLVITQSAICAFTVENVNPPEPAFDMIDVVGAVFVVAEPS